MDAAVVKEPRAGASPRVKARFAGLFWLLTILAGVLAMAVGGGVVVRGDAAATSARLLEHDLLIRLGIVANLIATACYVAATVFVYELLRVVNGSVSLLAALFSLVGCAAGAAAEIFRLAPLVVLGGTQAQSASTVEQLQSLAYAFIRLGGPASIVSFAFFGLHCLLVGCLILGSRFMPRFVGALMVLGGLGWLTYCLAGLLSPPLALVLSPYILLPGILGEGALTVWLLAFGVDVPRWEERAHAAGALRA